MQLSLFSISYAGLWGQDKLDLPAFIAKAGSLGFGAVMIAGKRPHLSPLDTTPQKLTELQEALRRSKVECAVLAAYTDFSGGGAAEVPHIEMQIAYVERLAALAGELGAEVVRVFTAYNSNPGAGQSAHADWARAAGAIRECCDRAAAHGVTIAIQNHHDVAVHTKALLEFLADVDRPNCKLGFDAWSPGLRGEALYEAAKLAAPHTSITTNADYVRFPRFAYQPELVNYRALAPDMVRAVPFGEGDLDYKAFFSGLKDGGFTGVATYEMCSPLRGGGGLANLDRCAGAYVAWMRREGFADAAGPKRKKK